MVILYSCLRSNTDVNTQEWIENNLRVSVSVIADTKLMSFYGNLTSFNFQAGFTKKETLPDYLKPEDT